MRSRSRSRHSGGVLTKVYVQRVTHGLNGFLNTYVVGEQKVCVALTTAATASVFAGNSQIEKSHLVRQSCWMDVGI